MLLRFLVLLSTLIIMSICSSEALAAIDASSMSNDLNEFEERYFGQSFSSEATDKRLDRIERMVYGARRQGSDDQRMNRLLLDVPDISRTNSSGAGEANAAPLPSKMESEKPIVDKSSASASLPPAQNAYPPLAPNVTSEDNTRPPVASNPNTSDYAPNSAPTYSQTGSYPQNPSYPPPSAYPSGGSYTTNTYGAPAVTAAGVPNDDDYPTVSALEKEILGQTYINLPIQVRLAAMEKKAFGAPSDLKDLSRRVQALEEYAAKKNLGNEDYLTTPPQAVSVQGVRPSLVKQVSKLEEKVFHKTYGHDSLNNRLTRLEKSVFPMDPPQTFNSTIERIDRLDESVNPVQTASARNTAEQHKHPLLHKLGKILGGVGMVAGEALMSGAMMGGYGYGGYGYGGYGMGFPGYGYGLPMMY